MQDSSDRARAVLAGLNQALRDFTAGRRDTIFQSRGLMVELSDSVYRSGRKYALPICDVVQRLLGNLLVHGTLNEEASVALATELLAYVSTTLDMPIPGDTVMAQVSGQPQAAPLPSESGSELQVQEPRIANEGLRISATYDMVDETRVGEVLVQMGHISKEQLHRALALQQVHRKRLGEILQGMGAIDSHLLEAAMERQRLMTLRIAGQAGAHPADLELRLAHDPWQIDPDNDVQPSSPDNHGWLGDPE